MSGNVNEWVRDVYRPMNSQDVADMNPIRGNVFMQIDQSGGQGNLRDDKGRIKMIPEADSALKKRRNYQRSYALDYMDGDSATTGSYNYNRDGYGKTTLISDKSRVYKGGGWRDMAYWLSPGTRRFIEENQAASDIGFRCAMDHFGAPEGTSAKTRSGFIFPARKQKR
jgi:formylglycine-generating enzyme required for sulfatase activity